MENTNHFAENLMAKKVNLSEIIDLDRFLVDGVNLYQIDIKQVYQSLTVIHQQHNEQSLTGAIAACSGGAFRSSRINQEFYLMRIDMPKRFSQNQTNKGLRILDLQEHIKNSDVTSNGYLKPKAFENPLRTLFLFVDVESEEAIDLIVINKLISDKEQETGNKVHLDIFVIPNEEGEVTQAGREFEQKVLGNS